MNGGPDTQSVLVVGTSDRGEKITRPLATTDVEFDYYQFDDPYKALDLFKHIQAADVDVILVDSVALAGLTVMLAGFFFSTPHVVRLRGDSLREIRRLTREYTKDRNFWKVGVQILRYVSTIAALWTSRHVIPVSHYLCQKYERFASEMSVVHTPCFMLDEEQPSNSTPPVPNCREKVVLSVMNMHFAEKTSGLLDGLEPISNVLESRRDTTMLIAGDGVHRESIEQKCSSLGGDIRTLGHVHNIEALYEHADVFVHFSYLDAYPSTVLEAYAARIPVIANDAVGMSEQVDHGETGYLVDFDDGEDISRRLNNLLDSPKLRSKMGDSGYDSANSINSTETVGKEFKSVLIGVVQSNN